MSQTPLPAARNFVGSVRFSVSERKILQYTVDTERELWSALEYYSEVEEVGLPLIQRKGLQPEQEILKQFQAFVRQAKSYYQSAKTLHYRSSSLLYYYSFLNLTKAYLLLRNQQRVRGKVMHGLSYDPSTTNIDFQLEVVKVADGVFPLFYEALTSQSVATIQNTTLNITNLLSYPTDMSYQYQIGGYGVNNTLSSLAAIVIDQSKKQAWTIIGIPNHTDLDNFLNFHANFLNAYEEVEIDRNRLTLIFGMGGLELSSFRFFQDRTTIPTIGNSNVITPHAHFQKSTTALSPYLNTHYFDDNRDFDLALPCQAAPSLQPIPMNEPLSIYAVMFYLSSLVRYRPEYLESLLNHKPAWIIESFVNTTPEIFLRIMVSKITEIDLVFRRR
ncbi:MAG: YaaC family protein [Ktedonobacteraceae bacterium]